MLKKQNKSIITHDIQVKANEIINEGEKTSLESKRIKFRKYIEEYYNDFTGNSDILVARYHDIDFFASTSKDIISSILIGIFTSTIVTFIFLNINFNTWIKNIIFIVSLILAIFLIPKIALKILDVRNKLYNYEKLHCEEFEKEIIERILDERLKKAEETISEKIKFQKAVIK